MVYYYFNKWKWDGTIEEIHELLRKLTRKKAGREYSPSLGIIDSQSVRTIRSGGLCRGIDGDKRTKGRKRHVVVDTMGLLMAVVVHSANIHDSNTKRYLGWILKVVLRKDEFPKFQVLPKRWIVERTFAWFERDRRLSKDFEFHPETSQARIHLAMIKIMLNRIKK